MSNYSLEFPFAHHFERPQAVFRDKAEDFVVDEELGYELTDSGEHLWLKVEKKGLNTIDVARLIAAKTSTRFQDIGYAGLKDKLAVTRQWFSVKSSASLSENDLGQKGVRILAQHRNSRKLRRGSHQGNRFVITLKNTQWEAGSIQAVSNTLIKKGVPNYFGPQRFGIAGNNLAKAERLFSGASGKLPRFQRGLILSAARSYLFNQVLASRVMDGSWESALPGELMALSGSSSVFKAQVDDDAIAERLRSLDIHPTGPMWGKGELESQADVKSLEQGIAEKYADLATGLVAAGLKQERRPLRLVPQNLKISTAGDGKLVVEFSLPKGTYATSVLREMVAATGL